MSQHTTDSAAFTHSDSKKSATSSGKPYTVPKVRYYQHIHRRTGDKVFHTFGTEDHGEDYLS